ncbi:MAG: class I SAM-dependent methyltransferase [Spirochaetales bacterium]|nr:class I SAM-dependent methyltransferase [Spirochaetales bacterium]
MIYILFIVFIFFVIWLLNFISYRVINKIIFISQKWDLNICCGKTDGGGVNADIYQHIDLPNFVKIEDIYNLPFKDNQFNSVICSHTMEHVDDPDRFFIELSRVGKEVTIVVPPIYDIAANLNFIEHKWVFLCLKKKHNTLPLYYKLPFSDFIQKKIGQRIHA